VQTLHTERSNYQYIAVYQTRAAGRMLVLDGVVQTTELDEFAYQEMLAHVALYAHPRPERVLVVGGGDGGIVREICKHACVTHIDLCDIDERVTAVAREFLPSMACSLDDPRVHIRFEDGAAFARRAHAEYDVIITDNSDCVGPAAVFYDAAYYSALRQALRPGGIVCSQGESMWLHLPVVRSLFDSCAAAGFASAEYAIIHVPTYPGGSIGALVASDAGSCKAPRRTPTAAEQATMRYYTPEVHTAAFAFPAFLRKALEKP